MSQVQDQMVEVTTEPRRLRTEEFHRAALELFPAVASSEAGERKVAVFDCDGTLWSGDAGTSFMTWSSETGLISREATDWIDARYRSYKRGEVSELAICGEMVQVYQGLSEAELRRAAREFFRTRIEPHIFPEMLALVQELRARGAEIWAVSSTCEWVIEEGCTRFGIGAERVLAASVKIVEGVISNTVRDVPTDEGKVAALVRVGVASLDGSVRPEAVFGNSVHDGAMLQLARHAFPVNPSADLQERSVQAGWPVYWPASARAY